MAIVRTAHLVLLISLAGDRIKVRKLISHFIFYKNFVIIIIEKLRKGLMYMAWTIEKITRECENICQRLGYEFNIPVKISGRMTKTLENIDSCKCNKCGSKELYYEQNW